MGITELEEQIEQLKGAASEGGASEDESEQEQEQSDSKSDQKKSQSPPTSSLAPNPLDPSP
jgi:hypothetical protein